MAQCSNTLLNIRKSRVYPTNKIRARRALDQTELCGFFPFAIHETDDNYVVLFFEKID